MQTGQELQGAANGCQQRRSWGENEGAYWEDAGSGCFGCGWATCTDSDRGLIGPLPMWL